MKTRLETIRELGKSPKSDYNKGYTVSVLIAIIFVSILLAAYYPVIRPPQKGFMTIYLLDSQKRALDYPELLVIGQNNSFNIWIEVENHMGKKQDCTVLLKVTNDTIHLFPFEVDASSRYVRTLENGKTWETLSTVAVNELGNYSVILELWIYDEKMAELQFSGNVCVLNLEVVDRV